MSVFSPAAGQQKVGQIEKETEDWRIPVEEDQTVLEALIDAGLFLHTDCGDKGFCG